jgi:hypothetical protein
MLKYILKALYYSLMLYWWVIRVHMYVEARPLARPLVVNI